MPNKDHAAEATQDSDKKGLHLAVEHEVKVDDYPERPAKDAYTKEQIEVLKAAGLL